MIWWEGAMAKQQEDRETIELKTLSDGQIEASAMKAKRREYYEFW